MDVASKFGLQKHPTFNELINYIQDDPDTIKYPDRTAIWAGDNPFLTQMDDDWQDETIAPRHEQLKHLLWLSTQKRANPSAVYDAETGASAIPLGDAEASSLSIRTVEDLTARSLAATTVVRTTETGPVASLPGLTLTDALGNALVGETGILSLLRRGKGKGKGKGEDMTITPLTRASFTEQPAAPTTLSTASSSGLVRNAITAVGSAASGIGTVAGVLGSATSDAVSLAGHVASGVQPGVDALGSMVGAGLAALDVIDNVVIAPAMGAIVGRAKEEAQAILNELRGQGPGQEPSSFTGTLLPVQVLNGEVPGIPRLALGSGPSGGSEGYPYGRARSGRSGGSRRRTDTP